MKNNFSIRDKKEKLIYKKGQGMGETLNAHTHTHTHACAHTHTHTLFTPILDVNGFVLCFSFKHITPLRH